MAKEGIEVVAPAPPIPRRGERFSKEDFIINLEEMTCTCPAGQVTRRYNPRARLFFFDKKICNPCPLRDRCTRHNQGRTVLLHKEEAVLQKARQEEKTDSFKARYRFRPLVERKIGELVDHGARQARYIGRVKTQLQMLFTGAVVNLKALGRFFYHSADARRGISVALGLV